MTAIRELKRQGKDAATWRGHTLSRYRRTGDKRYLAECKCCAGYVQVTGNPAPNEIDLGGSALGLNCPIKERS